MTPLAKAARTIAGLYNNSRPQGMGIRHFVAGKMPPDEALSMARYGRDEGHQGRCPMDYVRGRVIKVSVDCTTGLPGELWLYDRDLGEGAAEAAILDGLTDPLYAELDEVAE